MARRDGWQTRDLEDDLIVETIGVERIVRWIIDLRGKKEVQQVESFFLDCLGKEEKIYLSIIATIGETRAAEVRADMASIESLLVKWMTFEASCLLLSLSLASGLSAVDMYACR